MTLPVETLQLVFDNCDLQTKVVLYGTSHIWRDYHKVNKPVMESFIKLRKNLHFIIPHHSRNREGCNIVMYRFPGNKYVKRVRYGGYQRNRGRRSIHQRDSVWERMMKVVNGQDVYI